MQKKETDLTQDNEIHHIWDSELSDKEALYIGKIVAQWGAIEHEVFFQTIMTFEDSANEEIQLPKAMNNMQFTDVLEQWKERVINNKSDVDQATVLQQQYDKICHLKDYRNALVHGMWEWQGNDINEITTTRIRKKEITSNKFTSDDLVDFYTQLARINFQIRYPGGVEELIQDKVAQGSFISRRALAIFSNDDVASDWLSPLTGLPTDED